MNVYTRLIAHLRKRARVISAKDGHTNVRRFWNEFYKDRPELQTHE